MPTPIYRYAELQAEAADLIADFPDVPVSELASEGQGERSYDTKRGQKSPSWTTRLTDVPIAC